MENSLESVSYTYKSPCVVVGIMPALIMLSSFKVCPPYTRNLVLSSIHDMVWPHRAEGRSARLLSLLIVGSDTTLQDDDDDGINTVDGDDCCLRASGEILCAVDSSGLGQSVVKLVSCVVGVVVGASILS